MTNPVLIDSTAVTWDGWTMSKLMESVLSARGLTLDAATMRVVAIPSEVEECRDRVRRSLVELSTHYKNIWHRLQFQVQWVSGDTMIALPKSCAIVIGVFYGGIPMEALSHEDYTRFRAADDQGRPFKSVLNRAGYYYMRGISDQSVTPGTTPPDYRMVMELVPPPEAPHDADEFIVDFTARVIESADDDNVLQMDQLYQQWTRARATEMWGEDVNDRLTHDLGMAQRMKAEDLIFLRLEGTDEVPNRIRWKYPTLGDLKRGYKGQSYPLR